MKLLSRLILWITQKLTVPLVGREHRHRFCNGITARLILSTHYPRFTCEISEPLTLFLRPEFEEWRSKCIADFEKEADISFREPELEREIILFYPPSAPPAPRSPSRDLYDQRNI